MGIKGGCRIRLLRSKHILIRLSLQEDFVNLVSKGAFYITCRMAIHILCTLRSMALGSLLTKKPLWLGMDLFLKPFAHLLCQGMLILISIGSGQIYPSISGYGQ
ncbi:hypothetical protein HAX54_037969 [Datura stramonium]|uniref:Uncharacterized protein n=1 Tax=Datura stramonium TaxID=4076 RepID=A0ABS8VN46_DATST|nr:hypothetical protein [Datura stramonium]